MDSQQYKAILVDECTATRYQVTKDGQSSGDWIACNSITTVDMFDRYEFIKVELKNGSIIYINPDRVIWVQL